MKTLRHSTLWLAVLLLLASCAKDRTPPANQKQDTAGDAYDNLVACTTPFGNTLLVTESQKAAVLERLGAKQDGEFYSMSATNILGNKIPYRFRVLIATPMQIFMQNRENERVGGLFARIDTPARFSINGVLYRAHVNAKCELVSQARESDCQRELWCSFHKHRIIGSDWDSTCDTRETGKYYRIKYYELKQCRPADPGEMCIEAWTVSSEIRIYAPNNCAGPPVVTEAYNYNWNCAK